MPSSHKKELWSERSEFWIFYEKTKACTKHYPTLLQAQHAAAKLCAEQDNGEPTVFKREIKVYVYTKAKP